MAIRIAGSRNSDHLFSGKPGHLREESSSLWWPELPEAWPAGTRMACMRGERYQHRYRRAARPVLQSRESLFVAPRSSVLQGEGLLDPSSAGISLADAL